MQKLTRNRITYTGWLAAALVIGVFAGTGFQDSMKLGVVDLGRVITDSRLQVEAQARVQAAGEVMQGILDYMQREKVMTKEQCERLREIELNDDKTDQEINELAVIKRDVSAAVKDLADISENLNPTEEERNRLGDYVARKTTTASLWNDWVQEFEAEFQKLARDTEAEMIAKAQAATQEVAKREGYTLVFSMTSVVYAANDITDEVIKEADK